MAKLEYCEKCGWIKQQCVCEKPKTNADRIRSMTDEELAEWIDGFKVCVIPDSDCYPDQDCDGCTLKWLKSEVGCE